MKDSLLQQQLKIIKVIKIVTAQQIYTTNSGEKN